MLSKKGLIFSVIVMSALLLAAGPASAKQIVTDQLGYKVEVPDKAKRIVVLQHQALDILLQIGAEPQIVGALSNWQKYLPGAIKAMPRLKDLPKPGDLKTVNMESLLALNPDLVIITHYSDKTMRPQITQAGIPVIALSYFRADKVQASTNNPNLKDPSLAYTEGLKDAVRILGQVSDCRAKAEELLKTVFANRALVSQKLGKIPHDKRISCYMAYPKLYSMGTGKYASVAMERAGGRNVAENLNGYTKVSMEQVLAWNPTVIFIQDRYQYMIKEIKNNPAWAPVSAVKDNRLCLCPEYVKPWGHPLPESMALGELWMARSLYPEKFKDVDLEGMVNDDYKRFYGFAYDGQH